MTLITKSCYEPVLLRELKYRKPTDDTPRIVLDFETNEGVIDGNLERVWCLVISHVDNPNDVIIYYEEDFQFQSLMDELQVMLDTHCAVIHNASFDIWVAAQLGLKVECYECTQVLAYCINPGQPTGLKALGAYYDLHVQKTEYTEFNNPNIEELVEYCVNDCVTTAELYKKLTSAPCFKEQYFHDLYYLMELPFILVLLELNHTGVTVNTGQWEAILSKVKQEYELVSEAIRKLVPLAPGKRADVKNVRAECLVCEYPELIEGHFIFLGQDTESGKFMYRKVEPYNPASSLQTAWILEKMYDWKPEELTESGQPKLDKSVLVELPYELCVLLLQEHKLSKILTTYGQSMLDKVNEDGRLRTNYNQCVTRTGRLSSSSPNLQNIPKRGEIGDNVRQLFISSPGYTLVGCDVDSFQVRILSFYLNTLLGDKYPDAQKLFNEFCDNPDADPHQVNADIIGCERSVAKNCLFGNIFGFGVAKFASMSKLSIPEAQRILKMQNDQYPSIKLLKEAIWEDGRNSGGLVFDLFGRRGYYPDLNSKDKGLKARAERQSFNFVIQSTEASIIKLWLILIRAALQDEGLDNTRILMQVHDEILLECPHDTIGILKDIIQGCLQNSEFLGDTLPVTGSPTDGDSWYDVHQ